MTTISDNSGYIDYVAFGVNPENLRSLRALAPVWRDALSRVAERSESSGVLNDFIEHTAELPLKIADVEWQRSWMQSWHKLSSRGFSLADMFSLLNHAVAYSEADLYGDLPQVGRVQLDLFAILRRSVVAAVSCAIDLGEVARHSEAELPGEFAAMDSLRQMGQSDRQVAVLSVSLVNRRTYSHISAGELQTLPSLLREKLSRLLRPQDLVFIGHEAEWLLLLPDVRSMAQPALAATLIRQAFADPVVLLSGCPIILDVAIGAAMMPDHGHDSEAVIQAARLARASLQQTHEAFAMFDGSLRESWQQRHLIAEELRRALRQESLMLYLQPQVDVALGRCFGAELLLRWRRESGDWVAPPVIVDIIEEYGWRTQFTDWLIRAALRLSSELDAAGVPVSLSVNLTAGDVQDTDLPELVAQCLETWRLPGSAFTFELTESAMMGDRTRALETMHKLRELGIRLALDDFGTGYSSLSYLATLPINEIKIDRSFIISMSGSAEGMRIVRAIIDLTHDLGMRSLAEGVEDMQQRDQLLALGCKDAQGYLYGKPMPRDAFVDWYLARQS
ncbi:MAG: EAL domain-containing protein [Dechloromonas sp.]|nr:EAL domain-containing protein [Dechloromonas sp.]